MNLKDRFIQFIRSENLFQSTDTLMLAVSGGLDSVVLSELCHQAGYRFVIAHCNFKLRDKESQRDSEFVSILAKKYGADFLLKEFDTKEYASQQKISIQEAARNLRYSWFHDILHQGVNNVQSNSNWIVTAHHADDNIETVVMNFFRGTGIHGLRGILPKQGKIIRPLLRFRKVELKEFARQLQLDWVEDTSNQSDKYSRNYFRNQVIPMVEKIYPGTQQNILDNIQRFADIEFMYNQSIQEYKEKLIEPGKNEIHIPVLKLKKLKPINTVIHEIITGYGFTSSQVTEVAKLLETETGKYVKSGTHRIIKNRNWLIITPIFTRDADHILVEQADSKIDFELGELTFKTLPIGANPVTDPSMAQLDLSEITFPLLLRRWKPGDYFYPLGMKKKKKLSRFFIDQKLSKTDKEKVWVIEMNKKIVWVVNYRIDERFKITPSTTRCLLITLKR
jgi:tRNA(Ile)-lysidine synthase